MENYESLVQKQRAFYRTGQTKDIHFRLNTLNKLQQAIQQEEKEILAALRKDLNKSEKEAYSSEIRIVLEEIKFTLDNLEAWALPKEVETPDSLGVATSVIYPEPYGLTLIIAPWNYPVQLALAPLVGAIAGGNCAILKPSEFTPTTAAILTKLIKENFPEEYLTVVEGEVETSTALLKEKFDYIFFTGSTPVGKVVMEAASKHLTPLTLELGGKSPCIVHSDADLKGAAKSIARGKFLNAGQTCVAPDYLLVHSSIKDQLLNELKSAVTALYGEDIAKNADYPRIVTEKQFNRLSAFLSEGTTFFGGRTDVSRLFIEPTILDHITWDDVVMKDEIFGPILPVIVYDELSDIVDTITSRPKPLALYIFSNDVEVQNQLIGQISFGGGCINETLAHLTSPYLPFGGVGESGMGSYHGQKSFETFSHAKSILKRTFK
ncbi:aldehyde dehydrogenase (NAD+) [Paenibacillus shirakamiensis]|uniref:Aldehyde dehydrogenase n=1 Tax=Paenibacillus shirakamiensis TaxID=1265935 RepID=A0ABS4JEW6_9BACL|nr:aldehyde dehydrogenase [Paenibacillus shirakamiensis]MBP2000253.1 aldehyde dehydrogenase (NAD+) [Paenibacillus shirakamiensis]